MKRTTLTHLVSVSHMPNLPNHHRVHIILFNHVFSFNPVQLAITTIAQFPDLTD